MKVVAVSQRVDIFPERSERRDSLDQRLIMFLIVTGYVPVPVPSGLCQESIDEGVNCDAFDMWLSKVQPHAIVLSGGNDIGTCPERDLIEGRLLDYAQQNCLPVLGICRGMQMMGEWAGVKLKPVIGHVRTRHALVEDGLGDVNSYHNYALAECPVNFTVFAHSKDGEIEAIRHQTLLWEGWMWHPERELDFAPSDIERLKALFI